MSSFKDCRPTISRSPRVPCGNRTHLAGLEDQCLCRSANDAWLAEPIESGRGGSRTLKGIMPRPTSNRLPSPVGLALPLRGPLAVAGSLDANFTGLGLRGGEETKNSRVQSEVQTRVIESA
jgi:hypothetical protein